MSRSWVMNHLKLWVAIAVGIAIAFAFPNFTGPTEQAKALNAQNNLLAIYSAEKNYYSNNNGVYCLNTGSLCNNLADIDTNLSLNIQDDGTYSYSCSGTTCTAQRNDGSAPSPGDFYFIITLNAPIQLNKSNPIPNPTCKAPNANWCP